MLDPVSQSVSDKTLEHKNKTHSYTYRQQQAAIFYQITSISYIMYKSLYNALVLYIRYK
jgi:hypothetical protein